MTAMKKKIIYIALLLIVFIAAFGGWKIYKQKNENSKSSSISEVNNKTSEQYQRKDNAKYLVIKEWGVKLPLTDNISDASYLYNSNNAVYLTTAGIEKITGCSGQKTIVLERGNGDDPIGSSTVSELNRENPSALKKVGNYYYALIVGSLGCATSPSSSQQSYINGVETSFHDAKNNLQQE